MRTSPDSDSRARNIKGLDYAPQDLEEAQRLVTTARKIAAGENKDLVEGRRNAVTAAQDDLRKLGVNPDNKPGAVEVAQALNRRRLNQEMLQAHEAASWKSVVMKQLATAGGAALDAVGRGTGAVEKVLVEAPLVALQAMAAAVQGDWDTATVRSRVLHETFEDAGRLLANRDLDQVAPAGARLAQSTLGTASLQASSEEERYDADATLAAARDIANMVGTGSIWAMRVATAFAGGAGVAAGGASFLTRAGQAAKATVAAMKQNVKAVLAAVQGGEAGVSAAERVGKFLGIYRNAANPARQAELVERFIAKGYAPDVAEALAKPYSGMGEHFLPRWMLRRVGIPERALDSPFTVLKPRGISYGEMFELHYGVDPHFYGAAYGPGSQFVWRGSMVGAERFSALGRAWYGTPIAVKATGAAAGASYGIYKATQSPPDSEGSQ